MKPFFAAETQRALSLMMKTNNVQHPRFLLVPQSVYKILGVLGVCAAILFFSGMPQSASAAKLDGIDLPEQYESRYKALIDQLRCLVCQNETLADSDADLAADLRREIREKMVQGQSDKQITEFLVDRYGDFVLYNPPVKPTTLMLWYGPFALLALGVLIAVITIRRRGRRAPTSLDDEQHRQVQALLRRQDEEKGS
jgi:cytochrome c-type biogenesis protein CcmH